MRPTDQEAWWVPWRTENSLNMYGTLRCHTRCVNPITNLIMYDTYSQNTTVFSVSSIGSWWGNQRGRDHWGDLGVDGWIILGCIPRRWVVGMWIGLG